MSKREYLIASPPYVHFCGGINVLHKLCHMLNERGEKAYITGGVMNPDYNTISVNTLSQEHLRDLQHNGIIVLPDIVPFNPVRFTNVVRWWLGGIQEQRPNQLTFRFSDTFDPLNTTDNKMSVDIIEDFFIPPEVENRKGVCAYSGKGQGMVTAPVPETGHFDDPNPNCYKIVPGNPPTRRELAKIFQEKEVFYCYDTATILVQEARKCGCPVIMCGEHMFSKEVFRTSEYGQHGLGWYDENPDIEELRKQLHLFEIDYQKKQEAIEKELDTFIEMSQAWNPEGIYVEDLDPAGQYLHTLFGHTNFELFVTRG